MKKFIPGNLVAVTTNVYASYSNYGENPELIFERNMLGVVRVTTKDSVQVQFYSPATGKMEACICQHRELAPLKWPKDLVDLSEKYKAIESVGDDFADRSDWIFCGSMGPMSAINYLSAIKEINPEYFSALKVESIRLPGYHSSRNRDSQLEPECFLDEKSPRTQEIALMFAGKFGGAGREDSDHPMDNPSL